jgi:hypothetical protein
MRPSAFFREIGGVGNVLAESAAPDNARAAGRIQLFSGFLSLILH